MITNIPGGNNAKEPGTIALENKRVQNGQSQKATPSYSVKNFLAIGADKNGDNSGAKAAMNIVNSNVECLDIKRLYDTNGKKLLEPEIDYATPNQLDASLYSASHCGAAW